MTQFRSSLTINHVLWKSFLFFFVCFFFFLLNGTSHLKTYRPRRPAYPREAEQINIKKKTTTRNRRRFCEDFVVKCPIDFIFKLESDLVTISRTGCTKHSPVSRLVYGLPAPVFGPVPRAAFPRYFPARYQSSDVSSIGELGHLSLSCPANR